MVKRIKATAKPKAKPSQKQPAPLTFMDHIHELRSRLFWVALWFIVTSSAAFPFFASLIKLLMKPLGNEKLYYLTPVGGLSFAFKVCMYVGLIATLPILVYHIYRFIAPVLRRHSARTAIGYVALSFLLACTGIAFAYTVSLPAALHFLTHFGIAGVSPMLTVDSYLSFIIAYLFAGALLFQLPLVMLIIDSIRPTPPSQWGKYERHMIVAAFIIAMLITPTPNITDQVILAIPMIIMYQVGIFLVYLRHRSLRSKRVLEAQVDKPQPPVLPAAPSLLTLPVRQSPSSPATNPHLTMDVAVRKPRPISQSSTVRPGTLRLVLPPGRAQLSGSPRPLMRRNIDGIL